MLYKFSPCSDVHLWFHHLAFPLLNRTKWENGARHQHLFGPFQWNSATSVMGDCPWNPQKFHGMMDWLLSEISTDVRDGWKVRVVFSRNYWCLAHEALELARCELPTSLLNIPRLFPDWFALLDDDLAPTHAPTQSPLVRNSSLIGVTALELQRVDWVAVEVSHRTGLDTAGWLATQPSIWWLFWTVTILPLPLLYLTDRF